MAQEVASPLFPSAWFRNKSKVTARYVTLVAQTHILLFDGLIAPDDGSRNQCYSTIY